MILHVIIGVFLGICLFLFAKESYYRVYERDANRLEASDLVMYERALDGNSVSDLVDYLADELRSGNFTKDNFHARVGRASFWIANHRYGFCMEIPKGIDLSEKQKDQLWSAYMVGRGLANQDNADAFLRLLRKA